MQFWKVLVIIIVIAFLGWGIYNLSQERKIIGKEVGELNTTLKSLEEENRELIARIEYLKNPENLLKELKSQFNYREVGEGLIIVVPDTTSTVR